MTRWTTCVLATLALAVAPARGQGEAEAIARIIDEGTGNSHVWRYLEYLAEEIGPRLTGSTNAARANAWTRDTFAAMGRPSRLDKWGEIPVRFDRGPCRARMVEPEQRDFEFTSPAWSAGTAGPVRGPVLKAPATLEDLEAVRGDLAGAWILSKQRARRRRRRPPSEADREARELREEIDQALREAGIAGRIYASRGDLVVTFSGRGWRDLDYADLPSEVTVFVRRIDYDAMNSRLADGEKVVLEIDLQHHFAEGPFPVFNTIAEIRGTEWPEQAVIMSGHLDSWDGPGSQGAQDNGTGSSVVLEAARILSAAEIKPRRTIRFILWTGEEEGLLGSRSYVKRLSDEEKAGISAVFVEDGGTDYEGGLLCIGSMVPMLEKAVAPVAEAFPEMPVELSIRARMPRGGGSDHSSFNRAGIPGFFWQEHGGGGREGKNYRYIHHTQHDVVRYAVPEYLVQSAVCSALTIYNLAMADEMLPRQPPKEPSGPSADPNIAASDAPFTVAAGPLSGRWLATLGGEDGFGGMSFTLSFEMSDDGRARGAMESDFGGGPFKWVRWEPESGKVTFLRDTEQMGPIRYEATLKDEKLSGTLTVDEQFTRAFTAERIPAEGGDVAAREPGADKAEGTSAPPAAEPGAEKAEGSKPPPAGDAAAGEGEKADAGGGGG